MIKDSDVYRIGVIGKPHGVDGELTFSFDDDVFDRVDADYLFIDTDNILVPFFIDEYRFTGDSTALIRFDGIETADAARELTGCKVFFPYSLSDGGAPTSLQGLTGYAVEDTDGHTVGTITGIDDTTANVLLTVDTPDGRELLLPAGGDLVREVDAEARKIVMHVPEGLSDLNEA